MIFSQRWNYHLPHDIGFSSSLGQSSFMFTLIFFTNPDPSLTLGVAFEENL